MAPKNDSKTGIRPARGQLGEADPLLTQAMDLHDTFALKLRAGPALVCLSEFNERCPDLFAAKQLLQQAVGEIDHMHNAVDDASIKLSRH